MFVGVVFLLRLAVVSQAVVVLPLREPSAFLEGTNHVPGGFTRIEYAVGLASNHGTGERRVRCWHMFHQEETGTGVRFYCPRRAGEVN